MWFHVTFAGVKFKTGVGLVQGCFVVATFFSFFLLFLPTIRKLNMTLKNARATLLVFPDELVFAIPAMRNLLKDISRTTQSQR
jgi:hypothetical protein